MSISALNRWRWVYLLEAIVYLCELPAGWRSAARLSLLLGAALWLMHDLAHGRWRLAVLDLAVLTGYLVSSSRARSARSFLALAAIACAVASPEHEASPFVWARQR